MVENRGMAVADMTRLRAKARASGVYFRVVKNTLVRRAVAETPFASLADRMVGPLAYGIGPDPVAVAKVLNDFAKGNEKFVITGGGSEVRRLGGSRGRCCRTGGRRCRRCAGGGRKDRIHGRSQRVRRQQGKCHQGSARTHRAGPEGSQGPGRRGAEAR